MRSSQVGYVRSTIQVIPSQIFNTQSNAPGQGYLGRGIWGVSKAICEANIHIPSREMGIIIEERFLILP